MTICFLGLLSLRAHYKFQLTTEDHTKESSIDTTATKLHIPFRLCATCDTANVFEYKFCYACGTPPQAKGAVPRQFQAPLIVIDQDKLHERKAAVLASIRGRKGQLRKEAVADGFHAFVRAHSG